MKCENDKTPLEYAILEGHMHVVNFLKAHIFEKKIEKMRQRSQNRCADKQFLSAENDIDRLIYTPNKINYNFDVTSPYYVNITHRRKVDKNRLNTEIQSGLRDQEGSSDRSELPSSPGTYVNETAQRNLFELTEDNLIEFSRNAIDLQSQRSLIDSWRDKVNAPHRRIPLLQNSSTMAEVLSGIDDFIENEGSVLNDSLGIDLLPTTDNDSFKTVCEIPIPVVPSTSRASPESYETYVIQIAENYVHTDEEIGMVFYERKMLPDTVNCNKGTDLNSTQSTISTAITVPTEYDTDDLRRELTVFGHPPGPITSSTKRLYLKRLLKFKRNPALATNRPKSDTNPSRSYTFYYLINL